MAGGLIPIDLEEVAAPDVYGEDRVFVYIRLLGDACPEQDAGIEICTRRVFPQFNSTWPIIMNWARNFSDGNTQQRSRVRFWRSIPLINPMCRRAKILPRN